MRIAVAFLIVAIAGISALGQAPTLQVVTPDPNLPSELFYGNVKVKPARVRPGSNPPVLVTINDPDFFVLQHYNDFLFRMPDQSGFNFWVNGLLACGSDAQCMEYVRVNTSGAFFLSIECRETGYLVERLYKTAYGSPLGNSTLGGQLHQIQVPVVRFEEWVPDTKTIGIGVVVGQLGWEAALEANKVSFTNGFAARSRFTTIYNSMNNTQYVDALNTNAGSPLSAAERTQLIADLNGLTKTRAQVLRAIAEDQDLVNSEFNRAFVTMQYFAYLRRNMNQGNDTDYSGYEFWLNKMNQFNGNFVNAEMVKAFIQSIEYGGRF